MSAPKTQRPLPRLPMNEHSERVVLGNLLFDNAHWEQAKELTADDFSLHSHQRIFACIRSRLSIGRPIDHILLIDAMRRAKECTDMDAAYIVDLGNDLLNRVFDMESHVALLQEKAALRRIIGACHDASVRAYAEDYSAKIAEILINHIERKP